MLARLWWKEYRAFAPAWLILAGAAGLLQWYYLSAGSEDARAGGLTVAALCWAILYAFAVGAAAFAGEREAKTLGFLDALPVDRRVLWAGKATFALASTAGLALVLAGMAELGTTGRNPVDVYNYPAIARVFGSILFEAVAWSLLWSSLSGNPLLAAVLAVLSLYASGSLAEVALSTGFRSANFDLVSPEAMPTRLLVALAALATSGLVMTWRPRARPVSVPRRASEAPTLRLRASSIGRSLAWQAGREGWTTWVLAAVLAWLCADFSGWLDAANSPGVELALPLLACLAAGIGVFGNDTASGARRFLVHHGVAPGAAWWRKVLTWALAIGAIFGASFFSWSTRGQPARESFARGEGPTLLVVALLDAFAVGVLCGMTIPRRITAGLLGAVLTFAVAAPSLGLALTGMVPARSLFVIPLILLAASRAWAADWMLEREGWRPWLRLGAWVAVPLALLAPAFIAYRGWGVADVGRQYLPAGGSIGTVDPGLDVVAAYRRALGPARSGVFEGVDRSVIGRSLDSFADQSVIRLGWDPANAGVVKYWKAGAGAIEAARKLSALPVGSATAADPPVDLGFGRRLPDLLALDARERLHRGDLAGAWDDILAQFRMADQVARLEPTLPGIATASGIHHRAVGLAFAWLEAPGRSGEGVNKALADLKALPPLPDSTATIRHEAARLDRMFDLPGDELIDRLLLDPTVRHPGALVYLGLRLVAAPWERQRARRVCRALIAADLAAAAVEPWQRRPWDGEHDWSISDDHFRGSLLARRLMPSSRAAFHPLDRELVSRRALVQVVAIEAWKLAHDGAGPATLRALVPGLLAALPIDPYSGRPFGYVESGGQGVVPPIEDDAAPSALPNPTRVGTRLLYSVGPDRADNGGQIYYTPGTMYSGDYVYAIP